MHVEDLRSIPLFDGLTDDQLAELIEQHRHDAM